MQPHTVQSCPIAITVGIWMLTIWMPEAFEYQTFWSSNFKRFGMQIVGLVCFVLCTRLTICLNKSFSTETCSLIKFILKRLGIVSSKGTPRLTTCMHRDSMAIINVTSFSVFYTEATVSIGLKSVYYYVSFLHTCKVWYPGISTQDGLSISLLVRVLVLNILTYTVGLRRASDPVLHLHPLHKYTNTNVII